MTNVLIPSVCWSTSLWPIVQSGLKPKFVDVDVNTLNMNLKDLEKKISKKTKAVLAVHVFRKFGRYEKFTKNFKNIIFKSLKIHVSHLDQNLKINLLVHLEDLELFLFIYLIRLLLERRHDNL